ncbi:TraI domain-containing protein [Vibrio sp. PNB22_3_1]
MSNAPEPNHDIFLDPQTILSRPKCQTLLFQIEEAAGVNKKHFNELYMPVIENLARQFQSVPASEYNHHAYPFGLIEHTLEVAMYSLRSAYQFNYFPNKNEESILALSHIYMYCTFVSAMLHDSGKALTDIQFKIFIEDKWIPWSSTYAQIPSEAEEVHYKIMRRRDNNGNAYHKNTHELIAPMLLQEVVPASALKWIADYSYQYSPHIFTHLIHAVSGDLDNADAIGKNVANGDKHSVEMYLKNNIQEFNSTQKRTNLKDLPIHEAFLQVLRTLVEDPTEHNLIINKRHSERISHIERYGDMFFFGSKFTIEVAQKILSKEGINVPSERKILQILADNHITHKTPSEDTLWWCDFYTQKNNPPRDLSYFAVHADALNNPNINNLADSGVKLRFSPKTTNNEMHGPISPDNDYNKSLISIIFGDELQDEEIVNSKKMTSDIATLQAEESNTDLAPEDILPDAKILSDKDISKKLGAIGGLSSDRPKKENQPNRKTNNLERGQSQKKGKGNNNGNAAEKGQQRPQIQNEKPTNKPNSTKGNNAHQKAKPDAENQPTQQDQENSHHNDSTVDKGEPDISILFGDMDINAQRETQIESTKKNIDSDVKQPPTTSEASDEIEHSTKENQSQDPASNTIKNDEEVDPASLPNFFRPSDLPGSFTTKSNRQYAQERADDELIHSLMPYIQQQIDNGNLSFNRKNSPIHCTKYGLLICSPLFFEHLEKSIAKKHRNTIKRSSYCYRYGDLTMITFMSDTDDPIRTELRTNRITGFLLAFDGLKWKGKPLPVNDKLNIITGKE